MILPFINIGEVPQGVLKTEGVALGFQHSPETWRMLMNGKSCLIPILSGKHLLSNVRGMNSNEYL